MMQQNFEHSRIAIALALAMIASACAGGDSATLGPNTAVEQRLQEIVDGAAGDPNATFPGAIVHYRSPAHTPWTGAAGLGDLPGKVAMRSHDKIRGGSIVKPMLATVTIQHVEEGTLAFDQTLPELLPAEVTSRVEKADQITLRMLLNHRSGIPEWNTPAFKMRVVMNPAYVWTAEELIELSAQEARAFEPGASYSYSNTNYTLLGMVLDRAAGKSWRAQLRERVFERLALENSWLPEPGDMSMGGDYAHGYERVQGQAFDLSFIDPSMAGAAGGHALVTNAEDLGRFLEGLLAGELFADPRSLVEMTTMIEASDESGLPYSYGLGLEMYVVPNGAKVIGHTGGTAGYTTRMFQVVDQKTTIVVSTNSGDRFGNAVGVFLPAVEAVVDAAR